MRLDESFCSRVYGFDMDKVDQRVEFEARK